MTFSVGAYNATGAWIPPGSSNLWTPEPPDIEAQLQERLLRLGLAPGSSQSKASKGAPADKQQEQQFREKMMAAIAKERFRQAIAQVAPAPPSAQPESPATPSSAVSPASAPTTAPLDVDELWDIASAAQSAVPRHRCWDWAQTGTCPRGLACSWSHGEETREDASTRRSNVNNIFSTDYRHMNPCDDTGSQLRADAAAWFSGEQPWNYGVLPSVECAQDSWKEPPKVLSVVPPRPDAEFESDNPQKLSQNLNSADAEMLPRGRKPSMGVIGDGRSNGQAKCNQEAKRAQEVDKARGASDGYPESPKWAPLTWADIARAAAKAPPGFKPSDRLGR